MNLKKANAPWLDSVPADWPSSRIRNMARLSPGYYDGFPTPDERCTVVPMELLSAAGTIDTTLLQAFEDIPGGLTLFETGDVLFAKITPCMENGKGAFVKSLPTRYAFGSTEFHVLRPNHNIDATFLYYYTFNPIFRAYAAENMSGAAGQKRVSSRFLKDTRLFCPPLQEQERIAAYLDASCAAIDAAVAAKRRQIDLLDNFQRVTITEVVTRGLNESVLLKDSGVLELGQIPAHWRRTKLRYEISVRSGDFASDKLEEDGEYPVIGGNGEMGRAAGYNIDGEIVVVGRVGAYCGNAHYVKGRAWISDNALIVESNHDKRFLTHLIRVLDFNSTAKKTAQPLVTGTQIKNTYVGMPQVAEQEKIVAFIEKMSALFASLRETLSSQIEALTAYRKSLIHECVTGQRRISEADVQQVDRKGP